MSFLKCVLNQSLRKYNKPQLRKVAVTQIRAGSYQTSKPVSEYTDFTDFEIVHKPEEWKYVERLLPIKWIPDPKPKDKYPSGWIPQTADPKKVPYFVERTKNHMLPVYLDITENGMRRITKLRRVEGDIWKLSSQLVAYLKPLMRYDTIGCKVDELRRTIYLRGDYVEYTKRFLVNKGF